MSVTNFLNSGPKGFNQVPEIQLAHCYVTEGIDAGVLVPKSPEADYNVVTHD